MDSKWLQAQFAAYPHKTRSQLAKALGLDAPAISKILAGTRQVKATEYMEMRRFFGLPNDGERAARLESSHSYVLEPLGLSDHSGGMGQEAQDSWIMPASLFENRTKADPDKIRIFDVRENAMSPDFTKGEKILVDLSDTSPDPAGVFVVSDGMGYIIRQCAFIPHSTPPQIKFTATNNAFDSFTLPHENTAIIGRVIAKLQWL